MSLQVRKSRLADARDLANRLRPPDSEEITAASGSAPLDELRRGIRLCRTSGKVFSAFDDENMVQCIFGVSPAGRTHGMFVGAPWFLGSEAINSTHIKQFLRESSNWIEVLGEGYQLLENYVYAENQAHLKWLRRMGFEINSSPVKRGPHNKIFYRFRKFVG